MANSNNACYGGILHMSGFFPGLSVLVAFADMPGKYGSHSMGTASLSYYHHGKIYAQFFFGCEHHPTHSTSASQSQS